MFRSSRAVLTRCSRSSSANSSQNSIASNIPNNSIASSSQNNSNRGSKSFTSTSYTNSNDTNVDNNSTSSNDTNSISGKIITYPQLVLQWKPKQPLLGLDIGNKFIGVAISNRSTSTAIPYQVLQRRENNNVYQIGKAIHAMTHQFGVQAVVVGVPTADGLNSAKIITYVEHVWETCNIQVPIVLQDEAYSTYEALLELGMQPNIVNMGYKKLLRDTSKRNKIVVDKMSACIILKRALQTVDTIFETMSKQKDWMTRFEAYKQRRHGEKKL